MAHISQIPKDILLQIFSYFNCREKVIIGKVCDTWDMCVNDSSLWKTLDGTLTFKSFACLCKKGRFLRTRSVIFSKPPKSVSEKTLSEICRNLPNVRRFDFSKVDANVERILNALSGYCSDLCEIVISNTDYEQTISCRTFSSCFALHGHKITHLDMSYMHFCNARKVFILIAEMCPNLEELLVQNPYKLSSDAVFPIEQVQMGCPKLNDLRLGDPIRYSAHNSSNGFPKLEVFTHSATNEIEFTDISLQRLLFLSDKLKVLDLRGSQCLTVDAVCSLPTNNLERLYISGSKINTTIRMKEILFKWRHSLIELDVSKCNIEHINEIFQTVIPSNGMPELQHLTISFTKLEVSSLRLIIQNCTKLRYLQIEGCRRIGRRLMHAYHGEKALQDLLLKLDENE